jgi:SSS family solute:Na+ symporter
MTELPIGITGLILSALIAAAISSLDSDLNCLSAVGVEDYYKRFRPNSTDAQQLWVGKLLVVISGIGAILVALFYLYAGKKGVLGIIFTLYAIFSGGIAGMFLLGLFSRRANKQGLYIGIAASVLFTAWALLTSTPIGDDNKIVLNMGKYNYSHHKYMLGVYSHFVLFIVAYIASFFFKTKEYHENLTIYGWLKKKEEKTTQA